MSELRVDNIVSQDGTAAPVYTQGLIVGSGKTFTVRGDVDFQSGANVSGAVTFSSLNVASGFNVTGVVTASGGFNIGIQSGGTNITTGVITAINFVGTGNTISYNTSTKTVEVSISGSSGGSVGSVGSGVSATGINTGGFWSNPNSVDAAISLTNPNHNYGMFGPVALNATVIVGAGNTFTVV
jgi:hypothetical protein